MNEDRFLNREARRRQIEKHCTNPVTGAPLRQSDAEVERNRWVPEWLQSHIAPPPRWEERKWRTPYERVFVNQKRGLKVIVSARVERDGRCWLHVSYSHRQRVPNWEEGKLVKADFIGDDRLALIVLPPASEYVNLETNVLHLWHCITERPVPDFRIAGGI